MGVAIAIAIHVLAIDTQVLLQALQNFSPVLLLAGGVIVLIQIAFQISRLWVFCPPAVGVAWWQAAKAFISGQFVSNFIQNQTGHAIKVAMIRQPANTRGRAMATAESTAIVLVDKVTDVAVLLGLTGLAFTQLGLPHQVWRYFDLNHLGWVLGGGGMIALLLCGLYARFKGLRQWFSEFKQGLAVVKSPFQMGQGITMALGDWCSEGVLLQLLCMAQGLTLAPAQLIVSLLILNLGISVPVSVANLGTFEASLTFALTRFGVPVVQGIAIATLFHIFQLLGIALWMVVVLPQRKTSEP